MDLMEVDWDGLDRIGLANDTILDRTVLTW